jgi:hypothetical protein
MRRAARRDASEPAIIEVLTQAGALVQRLSLPGCPDLLVMRHGRLWLVEIKDGAKVPSRRKLTPVQALWHHTWADAPIVILRSVEDALAWLRSR